MGGGISSLSKVCVIGPPTRADADVDYTFAQVAVDRATVDYGANCGNMSAAIGPFAVDERLVPAARDGEVTVRIHNTNTGKLIHSSFEAQSGQARVDGPLLHRWRGRIGSADSLGVPRSGWGAHGPAVAGRRRGCMSCGILAATESAPAWWMRAILASSSTRRRWASTAPSPLNDSSRRPI